MHRPVSWSILVCACVVLGPSVTQADPWGTSLIVGRRDLPGKSLGVHFPGIGSKLVLFRQTSAGSDAAADGLAGAEWRGDPLAFRFGKARLRALYVSTGPLSEKGSPARVRGGAAWDLGIDATTLGDRLRLSADFAATRTREVGEGTGRERDHAYRIQAEAALLRNRVWLGRKTNASLELEHASVGTSFYSPLNPRGVADRGWTRGVARLAWSGLKLKGTVSIEHDHVSRRRDARAVTRRLQLDSKVSLGKRTDVNLKLQEQRKRPPGASGFVRTRDLQTSLRIVRDRFRVMLSRRALFTTNPAASWDWRTVTSTALQFEIPIAPGTSIKPRLERKVTTLGKGHGGTSDRFALQARFRAFAMPLSGKAEVSFLRGQARTFEAKTHLDWDPVSRRAFKWSLEAGYKDSRFAGLRRQRSLKLMLRGSYDWGTPETP